MTITVCGINHTTASIDLREKIFFPFEKIALYLNDLKQNENITESVILSTCNRSEIYVETDDIPRLVDWYCRQHDVKTSDISSALYVLQGEKAVQHIMKVAAGLDSMVVGEPQIFGQLKAAFSESCGNECIGPKFHKLFQHVFSVAKEVRSTTDVGACPVSIASMAVRLAKEIISFEEPILLIGAGDTSELVLKHLVGNGFKKIALCNRNIEKSKALAEAFNINACSLQDLDLVLNKASLIITATSSLQPIITKSMMQLVSLQTHEKKYAFIDLSVPRNIETEITELANVSLYCIDDLKNLVQDNLKNREHAAKKAEDIISKRCSEYLSWIKSIEDVQSTIRAYRAQIENICQQELKKAFERLAKGENPADVLTMFSRNFTNKLLHSPSVQLRQAGVEGRLEVLKLAQELFSLSLPVVEAI